MMTVSEILEQAKALSREEREELVKLLVDTLDVETAPDDEPTEHWGKSLNKLLDEIGPIEMKYPEIEDPVEWVKAQRRKRREKRKPYWDGEK